MATPDRERLREAIADVRDLSDGSEPDTLHVLVAAARAVLEAPEVWWCEVHEQAGRPGAPFCIMVSYLRVRRVSVAESCRMVRVFLVPSQPEETL